MKHGPPLVEACLRNKTDYIDSTGESPFIRDMIDKYHDRALAAGVRIIPSCGFDSIPSDLGTLLVTNHFAKQAKKTLSVKYSLFEGTGGVSGGTIVISFSS
jgi:short subunit dehydrogenase-like uncharacterized protein